MEVPFAGSLFMSKSVWRKYLQQLSLSFFQKGTVRKARSVSRPLARAVLEELESRLAPAGYVVNSNLAISPLGSADEQNDTNAAAAHAVVFFESSVTDYQALIQGLAPGTDAVVLDSTGDGVNEMAAFLAGRQDLTSIGVVAHGSAGAIDLGTAILDGQTASGYRAELATIGAALDSGGEIDFWSCDVAAGAAGHALLLNIAKSTGAGLAASSHPVGSAALGGSWQLDVTLGGAAGKAPFSAAAQIAFHEILPADPAQSIVSAVPLTIPVGGTSTVTLTANDSSGMQLTTGGSTVMFGLGAGVGAGTFSNVIDNNDGTYTSTFTATTAGTNTITGNIDGQDLTSTLPNINIYNPAVQFVLTNQSSTHITAGGTVSFTLTAEDDTNTPVPNYTGTVSLQMLNPNSQATFNGVTLPTTYTFVAGDAGSHVFNIVLATAGTQTITATDTVGSFSAATAAVTVDLGPFSPSASTITVAPSAIPLGGQAIVTLTAKDAAGNLQPGGGSPNFVMGTTGTGFGNFTNFVDHNNGIYTATFISTVSGSNTITGSLNGQNITSTPPSITINPATKFIISNQSTTSVTAGNTVSFSITAEDSSNEAVPGYTGTVKITSTDSQATFNGNPLPAFYTFIANDAGSHNFTILLGTATNPPTIPNQTVTVTDQANTSLTATTSPVAVFPGAFNKFVDTVKDASTQQPTTTVTSGSTFIFTVQATDAFGNAITNYPTNAPTTVSTTTNPVDPKDNPSSFQTFFTGNGFWFCTGTLYTVGAYTLLTTGTSTLGTFNGVSPLITVVPGSALTFSVDSPTNVITGVPFPLTVTARDAAGNVVTNYSDTVKIISNDPAAPTLISSYQFTTGAGNDNGVHTFNLTLKTAGTEIVQAIDTVSTNPIIQGSTKPITTNGLQVTAFNPTPTGFTATFNKTFLPADLTLYSQNKTTVMDVTLLGKNEGPIHGSLLIDPTNSIIIFNATASYLKELNANTNSPTVSAVLPDDTYTVTLVSGSGSNGFQDALGHLDGLSNNTHANFVTTFTTTYQTSATPALGIPDFARGPGGYTITSASENASNVVTMTTSIISNMQPGAQIVITNANPATYNGTYTILSTSSNTLTFNAPPGLGTYVGGGQANQDIQVLNDTNKGIPVTFYNANNVSDATFTLSFNPSLLQVTGAFGGTGSDASDQAAPATSFTLAGVNTIDATHAVASFTFHDATPQTGTVILGDILAIVPSTAFAISTITETGNTVTVTTTNTNTFVPGQTIAINGVSNSAYNSNVNGNLLFAVGTILAPNKFTYNLPSAANKPTSSGGVAGVAALGLYQQKELLQLGNIVVNGSASSGTLATAAIHVNAYFGDVGNADGIISGLDTLPADSVAQGHASGFLPYQLLDPVIIGDVANDLTIDAGDVSAINNFVAVLRPLQIPQPPGFAISSPNQADPLLSLSRTAASDGSSDSSFILPPSSFNVTVNLDNPAPAGSTGLDEAILTLAYDPSALSVTAQDITLGTIPGQGTGWQISSVVDATTGQIAIELYSSTPVTATTGGSLVNIAFHVTDAGRLGVNSQGTTLVQLVNSATINGQSFSTMAADALGRMVLDIGASSVNVPLPVLDLPVTLLSTATAQPDRLHTVLADDADQIRAMVVATEPTEALVTFVAHETGRLVPAEFLIPPTPTTAIEGPVQFVSSFQIGIPVQLNTFLLQNSPLEQNLRKLLPALTRWAESQLDVGQWSRLLTDLIRAETEPPSVLSDAPAGSTETDPHALLERIFAQMANDTDDFGDL